MKYKGSEFIIMKNYIGKRVVWQCMLKYAEQYGEDKVWAWLASYYDGLGFSFLKEDIRFNLNAVQINNREYARKAHNKHYYSDVKIRQEANGDRDVSLYLRECNATSDGVLSELVEAMEKNEDKQYTFYYRSN